ncbi:MAG: amidohydrolase family protein, partial [Acidimicrobiales bacterium]
MSPTKDLVAGLKVIDTDTHWSEPYDLWTSRAPSKYVDRVPQMAEKDGKRRWWFDSDIAIGLPIASSVIDPEGTKITGTAFFDMDNEMVHRASFDAEARVEMMDHLGVHAQVMYPNVAGFGNQNFLKSPDDMLRLISVQIYNDALAEFQDATGQRVYGMALLPWWDLEAAAAEIQRVHDNGLRGIVTCSNPEEAGLPDMAQRAWDPIWELCSTLRMPVNFHIGSSKGNLDFFGRAPWPSFGPERKLAVGSANLFMGNARVIGNMIYSGVPERFPDLKFVSVESGIGWLPFFLESLDHQLLETAPTEMSELTMAPSDYFRRQFFGTFWFEQAMVAAAIDFLGPECLMFETDFP